MGERIFKLIVNHAPPKELNPNKRNHWTTKNRAMSESKDEITWLARQIWHGQRPMAYARLSYVWHFKSKVKRDYDNLLASCKGWQDGLKEAWVIEGDDCDCLEIGRLKIYRGMPADKAIITVVELECYPDDIGVEQ